VPVVMRPAGQRRRILERLEHGLGTSVDATLRLRDVII
jgi:hypothetical protein